MEATVECVQCGHPLEPGAIACKICEAKEIAQGQSAGSDNVEINTLTRRAWGIFFFGLLVLQPILLPANIVFAISVLSKAKSLPARNPSIEMQLVNIIISSTVFSVLSWVFVLYFFDVL